MEQETCPMIDIQFISNTACFSGHPSKRSVDVRVTKINYNMEKSAVQECKWAVRGPRTESWFIYPPPIWFGDLKSGSEVVGWFWLVGWDGLGWVGDPNAVAPRLSSRWRDGNEEESPDWAGCGWGRLTRRHIWNVDVIIGQHFSYWLHDVLNSQVAIWFLRGRSSKSSPTSKLVWHM